MPGCIATVKDLPRMVEARLSDLNPQRGGGLVGQIARYQSTNFGSVSGMRSSMCIHYHHTVAFLLCKIPNVRRNCVAGTAKGTVNLVLYSGPNIKH